jgi:hypothetical protein
MLPDLFRPAETRSGLAGQAGLELPSGQLFTALIRLLPTPLTHGTPGVCAASEVRVQDDSYRYDSGACLV